MRQTQKQRQREFRVKAAAWLRLKESRRAECSKSALQIREKRLALQGARRQNLCALSLPPSLRVCVSERVSLLCLERSAG